MTLNDLEWLAQLDSRDEMLWCLWCKCHYPFFSGVQTARQFTCLWLYIGCSDYVSNVL